MAPFVIIKDLSEGKHPRCRTIRVTAPTPSGTKLYEVTMGELQNFHDLYSFLEDAGHGIFDLHDAQGKKIGWINCVVTNPMVEWLLMVHK